MKQLLYALCATAMLASCQKQDGGEVNTSNELRFRTYIEEGGAIRPVTMSRSLAGDLATGYHLNALLSTADYPTASTTYQQLMWDVKVNLDGTYQQPGEKKYFWEVDAATRHSFIAYSALPSSNTGNTLMSLSGGTSAQPTPGIKHTQAAAPMQQMDLLYSANAINLVCSGGTAPLVDLVFKHRLARVMFKLIGTGDVPLVSCQATITYKTDAVRNSATLLLAEDGTTTPDATCHAAATHNLGTSFSLPTSATTSHTGVEMGDMLLIPQNLAAGWVSLTLTYTPDGGSVKTVSTDIPAIDLSLAAGQQHEVLINVIEYSQKLSVSGITLTDWKSKEAIIDGL